MQVLEQEIFKQISTIMNFVFQKALIPTYYCIFRFEIFFVITVLKLLQMIYSNQHLLYLAGKFFTLCGACFNHVCFFVLVELINKTTKKKNFVCLKFTFITQKQNDTFENNFYFSNLILQGMKTDVAWGLKLSYYASSPMRVRPRGVYPTSTWTLRPSLICLCP